MLLSALAASVFVCSREFRLGFALIAWKSIFTHGHVQQKIAHMIKTKTQQLVYNSKTIHQLPGQSNFLGVLNNNMNDLFRYI